MLTRSTCLVPVLAAALAPAAVAQDAEPERYDEKLIHRPSPMPDRIILTWAGSPATSQAVTWRTDTSVTTPLAQLAVAEGGPGFDPTWGRAHSLPDKLRTVAPRTQ